MRRAWREPLSIAIGLALLGVTVAASLSRVARAPLARTTVRDALDSALIALTAAGCETPRLDAEVLLAAALGVDRAALIAEPARGVEPEPFREYVRRRARARAGGVHPRPQGLPAARAGGRPARADPAAGDRARRRGGARAAGGRAGGGRRHRLGGDRVGAGRRAARPAGGGDGVEPGRARGRARERGAAGPRGRAAGGRPAGAGTGQVDAVVSNPPYVRDGERLAPELAYEPRRGAVRGPRRARGLPAARPGARAACRSWRSRSAWARRGRRRAARPATRSSWCPTSRASSAWWSAGER